jgi:hypothetical protein
MHCCDLLFLFVTVTNYLMLSSLISLYYYILLFYILYINFYYNFIKRLIFCLIFDFIIVLFTFKVKIFPCYFRPHNFNSSVPIILNVKIYKKLLKLNAENVCNVVANSE